MCRGHPIREARVITIEDDCSPGPTLDISARCRLLTPRTAIRNCSRYTAYMQCVVYISLNKADAYLYVEREADFTRVPESLQKVLGRLEKVMNLELTSGRRLASADADEVMRLLSRQGYYLQLPPAHYNEPRSL